MKKNNVNKNPINANDVKYIVVRVCSQFIILISSTYPHVSSGLQFCSSCQRADGQLTSTHAQQAELLQLQSTSFSNQLELQRNIRLVRQKEYELVEVKRRKELMETDLQEMQQQEEATVKHNQVSVGCFILMTSCFIFPKGAFSQPVM